MNREPEDVARAKQQLSGIFDRAAATYDHVGPRFFSHFGRRLIEIARIPSGSEVLDVATGRGALLYPAAKSVGPHGHVIGIDLSEVMVRETAKELACREMSPNVEVRQMDAEHLQFPDESFDFVLCGFALFFFPQLHRAMSEFCRVLKPGGHICVTTFDQLFDNQLAWFDEIVKAYLPPEPEQNSDAPAGSAARPVFDTPEGLKAILSNAGFDQIEIVWEAADFVYGTEEEYWSALWSHAVRGTLEKIERVTGAEGLEKFRLEVFKQVGAAKQADGFHQLFPVLVGLAAKPPA